MNPFDYLNSINYTKEDLMIDEESEEGYNPFMINRGLSYFSDTVLIANEMNMNAHLDNRLQYDFLMDLVRKRKRFSKWMKPNTSKHLESIMLYYNVSEQKASQYLELLSDKQLKFITEKTYKGGRSKGK